MAVSIQSKFRATYQGLCGGSQRQCRRPATSLATKTRSHEDYTKNTSHVFFFVGFVASWQKMRQPAVLRLKAACRNAAQIVSTRLAARSLQSRSVNDGHSPGDPGGSPSRAPPCS